MTQLCSKSQAHQPSSTSNLFSPPVCSFSRKPSKGRNIRKRPSVEDDDDAKENFFISISEKNKAVPLSKRSLYSSSDLQSKAPIFRFESSKEIQVQNNSRATATLETETEFSKDARAIRERERVLKQSELGKSDEKLYKGIHGYTDYKDGFRRELTVASEKAGGSHGPLRASAHIRVSARLDYEPNICFIASYLIKSLLEKGHTVRTTARDPEDANKIGFLWELNGAKERLKIVKADLLTEESFDKAIDGVYGVFHTASPVLVPYDENIKANLIDPCIKGTLNVLNSCKKASSVKRVVLTSSCSAVRYRDDAQRVSPLNETHWSDTEYCKRYNLWYAYAKTEAEKEAWKFAKENGIDLVVVNPSFVIGPLLAPQPTSSMQLFLAIVKGLIKEYPNTRVGFVHIDDVVAAHILAMEESKASGRLICSSSVAHWSEIIEMLREKYPLYPYLNKCIGSKGDNIEHSMDSGKIHQLGLPPLKSINQMFKDCIESFQDKGFL